MRTRNNVRTALVLATVFLAASPVARPSGFRLPEASITGLGVSNALVANPNELGALPYNPAAMSFHEGVNISAGAIGIFPSLSVDPKTPNAPRGTVDSDGKDVVGVPTLFVSHRFNDWLSLGLNVGSPFGLETKWEDGTFSSFQQADDILGANGNLAGLAPTHSKLEMLTVTPNVAFKIGERNSVSFGVDYHLVKEVFLDSVSTNVNGDGDGFGWTAAFMHKQERWAIGASFHSKSDITIRGSLLTTLGGQLPGPTVVPARTTLNLPWRFQAGVFFQATEKLGVELDFERTGWSRFDQIKITSSGIVPGGTTLTTSTNEWDDANAYRIGLLYQLTPNTQLRLGYTYDQTPQDDDFFNARIPDADRQLFSVGLGHKFGKGWQVEAGYMYVLFDDRDYSSNRSYLGQVASGGGTEPNGTNAYNGDYEADVHLVGVGINKAF